jgi:triacylglycerol lipase
MAGACLRKFKLALICSLIGIISMPTHGQNSRANGECVILLHGLARSNHSMRPLQTALQTHYTVVNRTYPSRKHSIEKLAKESIEESLAQCEGADRIHFVTHSLGGILVRQYLATNTIENLGHVVMLGPPNNGSELVEYFQTSQVGSWLFQLANGPAGNQIGIGPNSLPQQLGPVDFSVGVIAGNTSYNPLFSKVISGDDDGKVSVSSSKVAGMQDHIVVAASHTFMMRNQQVISQVKHFLSNGRFEHERSQ